MASRIQEPEPPWKEGCLRGDEADSDSKKELVAETVVRMRQLGEISPCHWRSQG